MTRVGVINLGCPKNRVDAEEMLGEAERAGYEIENDPAQADVLIVNTCGFIESARRESIEAILDAVRCKTNGACRSVIVTGCLAQRYGVDLSTDLPEVDAVVGLGRSHKLGDVIRRSLAGERIVEVGEPGPWWTAPRNRILSTRPWTAYLRIADGCDNRCTYCAIPAIRGRFASRVESDILAEARGLVELGVTELNIVGQDVTRYGLDTHGELRLAQLIAKLADLDELRWIRLLYCYPTRVTDELVEVVARSEKVCKYLDVPLQHCTDRVLRAMGRQGTREEYLRLFERIRDACPEVALRTTFILGFPGETEADFEELLGFVREVQFDRVGAFVYSPEEGTPALSLDGRVSRRVAESRLSLLMASQRGISLEKHRRLEGASLDVLVEERRARWAVGRSYRDAPEIDGVVRVERCRTEPGQFVRVEVVKGADYDLAARPVRSDRQDRRCDVEVLS